MNLNEIDLCGYGRFSAENKAGFIIDTPNLPTPWDFIYQNRSMLLRVDQHGVAYAQSFPPSDIVMFMRDRFQRSSVWSTWFRSPDFDAGPFTNFFRPAPGIADPTAAPKKYEVTFTPGRAIYEIEHEGLRVTTEVFLPEAGPTVCQAVSITNLRRRTLKLSAMPVLRHACQWADMAAWDKPEWYLRTAFFKDQRVGAGFSVHVTSPVCDITRRRAAAFWSDLEGLTAAEVSYDAFIGNGTFENPESVARGGLELGVADARKWGEYTDRNQMFSFPPVCALQYDLALAPGRTRTLRQVFAWLPMPPGGLLPDVKTARRAAVFLKAKACQDAVRRSAMRYENLMKVRQVKTPDPALNRYTNEWMPVQLDWVCSLDRGWPTKMRGGRDAANDFTAMAPLDPAFTRALILTELSCQRVDGWVPRHFSAKGHSGPERDVRQACDAGAWVLEMVYEYLCHTKDFDLLKEVIPWLDQPADRKDTVLEHLIRAVQFFINDANLGEHGLVKLWEGEWLDTVNRAGMRGRGEGVMVTAQVIMSLVQMQVLIRHLADGKSMPASRAQELLDLYERKRVAFTDSMRKHAWNSEGYFNGFFNDDGHWLFSPKDPDGQRRVYGAASWWAIIAGVAAPDMVDSCLKEMDFLKCDMGYRLNWPPFVYGPVPNVGRMASGDSPAGRSEHANPYNQGSHGFLGRALAVAGKGDLLREVLTCLLPYDQKQHPVGQVRTAPYALVNVWQNVPRFRNRALMTFLTGSTAYAIRMVYDWMCGIRPTLDGLIVDPCIPSDFPEVEASVRHMGKIVVVRIRNPDRRETGVRTMSVNGVAVKRVEVDPFSRRRVFVADDALFSRRKNQVEVLL
jgi:cellobiose phosphorylase